MEEEKGIPRKTLGQQVIDKRTGKEELVEAGEISKEYQKRTFAPLLEEIMKANRRRKGKYYIHFFARDSQYFPDGTQFSHIVRESRPRPMWSSALFSYTNPDGPLMYEWVLPPEQMADEILENPEGFDQKYFYFCKKMKEGSLE